MWSMPHLIDVFVLLLFHQNSVFLFATSGVLCERESERAQASKCCVVFARCPTRLPLVGMGWVLIGTGSRVASPNCLRCLKFTRT